jgi:polyisoprenoid-binding protein YceI
MTTASTETAISLPTGTWNVDPIHSTIAFEVKHFGISTFRGQFTGFEGRIATGDGGLERVEGTVRPDSVDVRDPQLSAHLQSEDFFHVASHPEISFASTAVRRVSDGRFELDGELSIRGATRPVTLEVELDGAGPGPDGTDRISLVGRGEIDRTEFGIAFDGRLDNGALIVGEKVRLVLTVEAFRQEA